LKAIITARDWRSRRAAKENCIAWDRGELANL